VSGAINRIRALEAIRADRSIWAQFDRLVGREACDPKYEEVVALADVVHDERNLAASIASGSLIRSAIGRACS
jgi:3-polyprenyl-4-hydroxybenzoate decarboxylase